MFALLPFFPRLHELAASLGPGGIASMQASSDNTAVDMRFGSHACMFAPG